MSERMVAESVAREKLGRRPSTFRLALAGAVLGAVGGAIGVANGMPTFGVGACALGGALAGVVWGHERCTIYDYQFRTEVSKYLKNLA